VVVARAQEVEFAQLQEPQILAVAAVAVEVALLLAHKAAAASSSSPTLAHSNSAVV
jgi:hypothetical protein